MKRLWQAILALILIWAFVLTLDSRHVKHYSAITSTLPFPFKEGNLSKDWSSSLKNLYKKQLTVGFEEQAIAALAQFPELDSIPISFEQEPARFPLAARPRLGSLLLPWRERSYHVIISTALPAGQEGLLLKNLPKNVQIGVLGHELAHITSYLKNSPWQIAGIGVRYATSATYRKEFERSTDRSTVAHGLGWPLYEWSLYNQHLRETNPAIQNSQFTFEDRYLHPPEVITEMAKYPFYELPQYVKP